MGGLNMKRLKQFFIAQVILISLVLGKEVFAQEKVLLSTDRDIYIAGESIWLNVGAYQLDTNEPSKISKVIYVEIINKKNVPVLQVKYRVNELCPQTQFVLPDTLSTGNYCLRAYTRWMRNKDNSLYAHKIISIINPFVSNSLPKGDKHFSSDTIFTYPEGGLLFPEVENRVMIRTYNSSGKSIAIEGKVVDSDNKTVTSFKTNDQGYGLFKFIPEKNGAYFYCSDGIRANLPTMSNEKVYLQLSKQNSEAYLFTMHGEFKNDISLDIVSVDGVFKRRYAVPSEGNVVVKDKDLIGNVFFALLVDEKNNICAYRAFSKNKRKELSGLQLNTDKRSYRRREKVNLKVDRIEKLKNISISVVKSCLLNPHVNKSELSGGIGNDALIGMKPPRFIGNNESENLLPEVEGELITGRVTCLETGKPVVNSKFMLNFVSREPIMKLSTTDSLGQFIFNVNRYGEEVMVIQPFSNDTSLLSSKITLADGFSTSYSEIKVESLVIDSVKAKRINEAIVNMQVNTIYSPYRENSILANRTYELGAFYGKPNVSSVVNSFIELSTIEEAVREVVPFTGIRRNGDEFYFRVYEANSLYPRKCNTLTFMDGIPIKDVKNIFEIPLQELDKIEVVNLNFYIQDEELGHLLCFYSRDNNMADMEIDKRLFTQVHKGFVNNYKYLSPNYSNLEMKSSRIADFRNVLYYNVFPQNENIDYLEVDFYTSDEEAEFTIVVKGINEQGEFVENRKKFTVSEGS